MCGWLDATATKPIWAKMTPNITDIKVPARASLAAGMEGVAAINTIQSVIGVHHLYVLTCTRWMTADTNSVVENSKYVICGMSEM